MDYAKIKEQCGDIDPHCWGCFVVFKEDDVDNVKNIIKEIDEWVYDHIPVYFEFHILEKNIQNGRLIINEKLNISYICKMYLDLDEFYYKCEEKNVECLFITDTYNNCINENYPTKEVSTIEL